MSRRLPLLVLITLVASLTSGCGPGQADVERSIRTEMKSKMNVEITSFDLKKQADGSFEGTAVAQNGDVYDVTTKPPQNNKIEWKALPGREMVEKLVREGVEKQLGAPVKTLELTKNGPGAYSGPAELATGSKLTVTTHMEGTNFMWEAKPATP